VAAWAERPLAYPRLIGATPAQREHDARLLGDPLRQDGPREGDDDRVEKGEHREDADERALHGSDFAILVTSTQRSS
jgi:hypothetical protein